MKQAQLVWYLNSTRTTNISPKITWMPQLQP